VVTPISCRWVQSQPVELRQLRYFVVVCDAGSLTRAGGRLRIAQQSLSQTVAALEAELGVRLLNRGAFGVRPTAAGRVLQERATALLLAVDEAARAAQRAAGLGSGQVTMRYGLDAEHLVAPLLARVHGQLPELDVIGWTAPDDDNLHALRSGTVDLVLAWAVDPIGVDLHGLTVATERCLAAVPNGHPLVAWTVIPVQALAGRQVVMFPRAAAPLLWDRMTRHFRADGRLPPRFTQTAVSGQAGMVAEAIRATAVTPVSASLRSSMTQAAVRFLPFEPELTVPLQLLWRSGLSPAAARVVEIAASEQVSTTWGLSSSATGSCANPARKCQADL